MGSLDALRPTLLSPASRPAAGSFNGLHRESNLLAITSNNGQWLINGGDSGS